MDNGFGKKRSGEDSRGKAPATAQALTAPARMEKSPVDTQLPGAQEEEDED